VHEPHQKMVGWYGDKYVWTVNCKGQYAHYWRAMWGQKENAGTASRERQIPHGGIGKMGPGLSSGDGARSIVGISGIGFLYGTAETLQGTLLLNEKRKIRKFERTWEQS
jgi:hypothetical protein